MRLVSTPFNPTPPGAILHPVRTADGVQLRTARWTPPQGVRGTVAILSGRAEFIEKYYETIRNLLDRGLSVAIFDWRGQGGSARQLKNPHKGHIDDFSLYERDFSAFVSEVLEPSCPKPWFGLAHSMGGAIALAIARAGRCPLDRLALCSPMIGLAGMKWPRLTRGVIEGLDAVGLGGAFARRGGAKIVAMQPFENNRLTSDPARYARTRSRLSDHWLARRRLSADARVRGPRVPAPDADANLDHRRRRRPDHRRTRRRTVRFAPAGWPNGDRRRRRA